jgi:hypothetical protein
MVIKRLPKCSSSFGDKSYMDLVIDCVRDPLNVVEIQQTTSGYSMRLTTVRGSGGSSQRELCFTIKVLEVAKGVEVEVEWRVR